MSEKVNTTAPRGLLFTPRTPKGVRLALKLSNDDRSKMLLAGRNLSVKGEVTDLNTGKRYRITGASCGSPECNCDAVAVEITPKVFSPREMAIRQRLLGLKEEKLFEILEATLTTEQKEKLGESWFNIDRE